MQRAFACYMTGPARIGLGCMGLTGLYGNVSSDQAMATLSRALSMGVRLFDTAPIYGDGANEELLGRALAGHEGIFVTTKFGLIKSKGGQLIRDSNPAGIRRSVEGSLRRLRRERIDLLLQHRQDPRTPDDVVVKAVADLVLEGKVKAFGLSSTNVARAAGINGDYAVRAVQNELSIIAPPDADATPGAFAAGGVSYMAYSPLGRGVLAWAGRRRTFASDDYRTGLELIKSGHSRDMSSLFGAIGEVAARHGVGRCAVSLAWLLSQGANVVAIPGSRSPKQVEGVLEAARVALDMADLRRLNEGATRFGWRGVGGVRR